MIKKIMEKIKTRRQYREARKTLTFMIMNQYSDFLAIETKAKEAEKKAYESMQIFGEAFTVEDFRKLIGGIDKIANSPELQNDYYKQINENAHTERMTGAKKDK